MHILRYSHKRPLMVTVFHAISVCTQGEGVWGGVIRKAHIQSMHRKKDNGCSHATATRLEQLPVCESESPIKSEKALVSPKTPCIRVICSFRWNK